MAQSVEDNARDSPSAVSDRASVKPWAALASPQFRLLWLGQSFGAVGQPMREVANLWLVWELTGSALHLGLLGVVRVVPLILFSLVGGALADVVDRRKILVVSQVTNMLMGAAIAGLAITGAIQVWHIYAISLGSAVMMSFGQPARVSLIPALVPRVHLMNALTLHTTTMHASRLLGPSLGGIIIAWQGAGLAYAVNAAAFIPVIVSLLLLHVPTVERQQVRRAFNPREIVEGLRFIWATPVILGFILFDVSAMVFSTYRGLLPIFADEVLGVGPAGFGTLMSAPALGFLGGAGLLLLMGNVKRKGPVVLVATLLYAVTVALFALSEWYVVSLLLIMAAGGFDAIGTILRQTTLQLLVPDEIRGRATAVMHVFVTGGPSVGQSVLGAAAGVLGAPLALLGGSAVCFVAVMAVAARLREMLTYRE